MAALKGHLEVVRLLLEAGADKDSATTDGATALLEAAMAGHLEVVRLLLETGAYKDGATTHAAMVLFVAAKGGRFEVARAGSAALTSQVLWLLQMGQGRCLWQPRTATWRLGDCCSGLELANCFRAATQPTSAQIGLG